MIGYKGIEVEKGILRSKSNGGAPGEIFEIGIPTRKVEVDDDSGFSENGYSFCGEMEYVIPWEDFFGPKGVQELMVSRLFRIDTLGGKVIGGSAHYKAEQIVVLEEVTKDEIVAYFKEHPDRLKAEFKDSFEEFCARPWEPYKVLYDKKEINDLMIASCFRRTQKSACVQEDGREDINKCLSCSYYFSPMTVGDNLVKYWYLEARRQIHLGLALSDIEEYQLLKNEKSTVEVQSLERLYAAKQVIL